MKTRVWIGIFAAVFVVCIGLSALLLLPGAPASCAEIYSDGKLIDTLPLNIDRKLTVESKYGINVVTVQDGKIAVTEADCPDHYCMDRGFCSSGAMIVCLPNRLEIRFVAGETVDGAVG